MVVRSRLRVVAQALLGRDGIDPRQSSVRPLNRAYSAALKAALQRSSPTACRTTRHERVRPRNAVTAATARSGQCVWVMATAMPARMTATLAIASLRVHSHTSIAVGSAVPIQQNRHSHIDGEGKQADTAHEVCFRNDAPHRLAP